jgi:hypothetical protein
VTDADRVKLLFGPYRAPRLQRGDRAHCLYRDALVVITSWTDASIPWPPCRALDSHGAETCAGAASRGGDGRGARRRLV